MFRATDRGWQFLAGLAAALLMSVVLWPTATPLAAQAPPAVALPADLGLVPAEALGFVHVRVADIYNNVALDDYRKMLEKAGPRAIEALDSQFVPKPSTLDRVTLVVLPGDRPDKMFAAIVHFTKPFDAKAVQDAYFTDGDVVKNTKTPLIVDKTKTLAMSIPNPQTLVLGAPETVLAMYHDDKAKGPHPFATALTEAASGKLAMFAALNITKLPIPAELTEKVPEQFQPLLAAETISMRLALSEKSKVTLNVNYPNAESAAKADKALQQAAEMGRKLIAQQRNAPEELIFKQKPKDGYRKLDEMPEFLGAFGTLAMLNYADEILSNPPIARAGNSLSASVELPSWMTAYLGMTGMSAGLMIPAVQKVREAAARSQSQNNLKQIGVALHSYHDAYGAMPPAAIISKKGKPLLSWRVAILPYLEQDNLYRQFKLDEPWDSEHNIQFSKVSVKTYMDPRANLGPGMTTYKAIVGKNTAFPPVQGRKFAQVTDGLSNTIMVVGAGEPVNWAKPDDFEYENGKALPDLSTPFPTMEMLFMDGSVRAVRPEVLKKKDILKWLILCNDGNVIPNLD